jgi:hypothetical protein
MCLRIVYWGVSASYGVMRQTKVHENVQYQQYQQSRCLDRR